MKSGLVILWLILPVSVIAGGWQFSKPIVLTKATKGVFHHLGASGRGAIAVSHNTAAVVWEDNRSGIPQVYVAFKKVSAGTFQAPVRISDKEAAYEPGIAALGDGRFVVGWEAANHVWLRVVSEAGVGDITAITQNPSRQIALTATPMGRLAAVWAEQTSKSYQIHYAKLALNGLSVKLDKPVQIDETPAIADQLYPSIHLSKAGIAVGWEDRRFGNTRIFTSFAKAGERFVPYSLLNDFRPSRIARFGHGTGAMRVAVGGDDQALVVASWLDKRDFEGGYDVYAAVSRDGGKTFGKNELVQDVFGENTPQWHNTVAVSPGGQIVVAWDDSRDGAPHLWLSERWNGKWSADVNMTNAGDNDRQSHPVICFDKQGRLHAAFIEQVQAGSRIMYLQGK